MTDLIDIHADDYGLSAASDKTILELLEANKLTSISFMTNLSRFENAVKDFQTVQQKRSSPALVSVHLNFVEGHCAAPVECVPDLIDKNGYFTVTWEKLFLWNYNPLMRNKIRKQLSAEITAQTERLVASGIADKNALRFDSHMHTHMIPLVFDALKDSVKTNQYKVSFIRNTQDPLSYYAGFFSLYKTYSPINAVKCMILNFYSCVKIRSSLKKMSISPSLLCGVFFSGKMNAERLEKVLPVFIKNAQNQKRGLEVLFHPCLMAKDELTEEFNKPDINEFHISENRIIEYKTCKELILSWT
ncbi:MAG: ChbG/HpnK family deacetylase [Treponema sp.]|nr:ChbG/HpnK family deacetylase [Treponema sp.]MBR1405266.1 ChbG/HpnK family deacetylase [Treponema sp.]